MNSDTADLRHLFLLAADGDQNAFSSIYLRYHKQVYGASFRLTRSHEDAQDISQRVFLKLLERRLTLKEIHHPLVFMRTMASNYSKNLLRSKTFSDDNIDRVVRYFKYNMESPQRTVEDKQLWYLVKEAVETLPPRPKEVFKLKHDEEMSHEAISAQLGISYESSKKYISRAYELIREYMLDHMDEAAILVCMLTIITQNS